MPYIICTNFCENCVNHVEVNTNSDSYFGQFWIWLRSYSCVFCHFHQANVNPSHILRGCGLARNLWISARAYLLSVAAGFQGRPTFFCESDIKSEPSGSTFVTIILQYWVNKFRVFSTSAVFLTSGSACNIFSILMLADLISRSTLNWSPFLSRKVSKWSLPECSFHIG